MKDNTTPREHEKHKQSATQTDAGVTIGERVRDGAGVLANWRAVP